MRKSRFAKPAIRLLRASITIAMLLNAVPAFAQMQTQEPGPGGVPLAPGSTVNSYTPGGIGPGGTWVSPGPAAQGVPTYQPGPGPQPPHPSGRHR
jgi:hypothetical protein